MGRDEFTKLVQSSIQDCQVESLALHAALSVLTQSPVDVRASCVDHPNLLLQGVWQCLYTHRHMPCGLLTSVAAVQVRKDEIDLLYNLLDINRDGLLELKEVVKSQERLGRPFDDTIMRAAARAA